MLLIINRVCVWLVPPSTAISPSRVVAAWPHATEVWISGSSVTPICGCPSCHGAVADMNITDSSAHRRGGPHPQVSGPLGTCSDKALNPDSGRSTLWSSVGLSGQTQGRLAEGSSRYVWGCASLLPGAMLGPWQGNSAVTEGIGLSAVLYVSDKTCKQISYCILRG